MRKVFNLLAVSLFVLVASLAPYVSAKGAALAFAQNPEERTLTNSSFEEEIFHPEIQTYFISSTIVAYSFPHYIDLTSQHVIHDVLKPPLA